MNQDPQNHDKKLARAWMSRIRSANNAYETWHTKYKCDELQRYYEGFQGPHSYFVNMVFAAIEIKKPTLFFQQPQYHVKAKPQVEQYDMSGAVKRSQLESDILNTFASSHIVDFSVNVEAALLDAFFRFGVIEVDYEADWIDNPNADKPILKSDSEEAYRDSDGNVIKQPKELPQEERIYVKRINPRNFRVSGLRKGLTLQGCDWYGYWEYERFEDLKANKKLKNTDDVNWPEGRTTDDVDENNFEDFSVNPDGVGLAKVWRIWDNRNKRKYIFEEKNEILLKDVAFKRTNLFTFNFHPIPDSWYPLPPVYNWKPPQDEYNDSRTQNANHRKRFIRKFLFKNNALGEQEKYAIEFGADGELIGVNGDPLTVMAPVPQAELGQSSVFALNVTQADFNLLSATSADLRNQSADRTTATEAGIVNQKGQIRDSFARNQVAKWLSEIGREILLCAKENLTLPFMVRMEIPNRVAMPEELSEITEIWKQISYTDIKDQDDYACDVNISLDSLSPVENGQDLQAFTQFVSMLKNFPELAADPDLIQETAYRCGYRNDKVIKKMMGFAQLVLTQQLAQLTGAGQPGQPGNGPAQQNVAAMAGPQMEQINNAMQNGSPQVVASA